MHRIDSLLRKNTTAVVGLLTAAWWVCASGGAIAAPAAQDAAELPAAWLMRLGQTPSARSTEAGPASNLSLSVLGDYYFAAPRLTDPNALSGGFRATGGLFVGPRSGLGLAAPSAWPVGAASLSRGFGLAVPQVPFSATEPSDVSSVPYLGVGYSGLKALRATGGGWSFNADVGVVALQPRSAVRFGQQSLGETLRDLQLSPMLQLGVSYSF